MSDFKQLTIALAKLREENERLKSQLDLMTGSVQLNLNTIAGLDKDYKELKARNAELVQALKILKVAVNDKVKDPGATSFIERTLDAYQKAIEGGE